MTAAPASGMRRLAGYLRWLILPCAFSLALPLLGRWLPPTTNTMTWLLDLAAHWQLIYAGLWLALCLLCTVRTWRWLLLAPLALLPLFSASRPLPQADDGGTPALVVVAANVYVGNRNPAPLLAWLKQQSADVVVLSELSEPYAQALSLALGDDYRYRELHAKNSPFGIGVLSRLPLHDVVLIDNPDGVLVLAADVSIGLRSTRIVAAHPMPPLAPEWHHKRDEMLSNIAKQTGNAPLIVAGDLNATPWSTALFAADRDGLQRATGLAPTWPHWGRGVFGIPIDHVLASTHWQRGESSRGPDIGSDHRPVRVTLHWANDGE